MRVREEGLGERSMTELGRFGKKTGQAIRNRRACVKRLMNIDEAKEIY